MNKIKNYIKIHKVTSIIILLIVILIGYWIHGKLTSTTGETRYVLSTVTKGTIISSVTGSGQVSALNQLDLKPNVSGTITYIGAQPGDKVVNGELLFSIDDITAQKSVRDAEVSLQSAQIALDKLKIQNSDTNLNNGTTKVYDDGFSAVKDTFYDLNSTLNGINTILTAQDLSDNAVRASGSTAIDYRNKASNTYYETNTAFEKNNKDYSTINNSSSSNDIKNILQETYNTTKLLSNAIKDSVNLVDYMARDSNSPANFSSYQTSLATYLSTINGHLANLLSAQSNIKNNEDALQNSSLDIQNAELTLTQKQNALQDTKDNLSYYFIRSPFTGTMASVPVKLGDNASSSTILGTVITPQQTASISLNEVDIAKIQLGQKVTLTFDAIPNLTITGKVIQIDSIGTVSQGVVSYNVKMSFDTSDDRVKPGMSVNAAIITNVAQNVLTVPNGAVKNLAGTSYVQIFSTPLPAPLPGVQGSPSTIPPTQQIVATGVSDNTSTEIISGLKEGDLVISKTISPTATTTSTAPSILGNPGARIGGGGRIGG